MKMLVIGDDAETAAHVAPCLQEHGRATDVSDDGEAIRDVLDDRPELAARLDTALHEADALLRTFEAMLRIAQVKAGARRARFDRTDLSAVTDNVVDAFRSVAEDDGKHTEATISPGIMVVGDQDLLTQMLADLIENAIRHTPTGTRIRITLSRKPEAIHLTVADDGPGIPMMERRRVFNRFYRTDTSWRSPGSGLGLSLMAAIVNLHGGSITLDDHDPGLLVTVVLRPLTA